MSKFEGYSHEQLWAMVSGANEHVLKTRATSLVDAAKTIHDVGDALKKHKVEGWDGEAAQKFHDWVSQAGSATLRLAEYSKAGGESLSHAADVLSEVKKSAAYDAKEDAALRANIEAARKHHNDPDAPIVRRQSTDTLTDNQQRAAAALLKLAERYDQSAKEMKAVEVPTFPPPPGDFVPVGYSGLERQARPGEETGSGVGPGGSYASPSGSPKAGVGVNDSSWAPRHQPQPDGSPSSGPAPVVVPSAPDREVDVDLDHVSTLPETSLPPTTSTPGPGTVPGGPNPVGTPPPLTLPPMTGGGPGLPGIGPGGLPPGIAPGGKVGGKIGGLAPVLPRDAGIVGGRQVPVSGPSGSIPRGTVIGEGMQGGGRGMMGGGMGGGGLGGSHGVPGGSMAGRRLAMEQGGVVGGRQPGVGGRSTMGGQPFTQGGSGLVRNGSGAGPVGGAMGHGGTGVGSAGRRRDEQGGERPDYLSEDEETWQANRRVVPPVID
ncbi:WXG100 family type VII secretion target [Streptomyces goshikiensis]|uniref:WXG100 family type VII secretion target n=1 Tax=Streptomyces goshikiensis TaxID=1942 RepID=UPI00368372E7